MNSKTLYINGNFLSQPITGVQRFGNEVLKELDSLAASDAIEIVVLTNNKAIPNPHIYKNIRVKKIGITNGKIWEQLDLFIYTFGKPLVTFASGAPVFKLNQYFTIHDTAIYDEPAAFTVLYRTWYKLLNAIITLSAKKVFTVSVFSSSRLQKILHISKSRIQIVYSGGDHIVNVGEDVSVLNRLPTGKKYVLAVGSLNPNKNFSQVIKAAAALQDHTDIHFVIAGAINTKVFRDKDDVQQMNGNITYLGRISDEALKALYKVSRCFLFPSLYEGFGVPVIEAMFCGCPVVCSNRASLSELFSNYTLVVDPLDTEQIVTGIKEVLYNKARSTALQQQAVAGTKIYTWSETAKKIYEVIKDAYT